MQRSTFFLLSIIAIAGCSSSTAPTIPVQPPVGGGAPPPMHIAVTEYAVPVSPLYVAAAADDSVYFGFGSNGTGSNLYHRQGPALTQTSPASNPSYSPGGGVYGIAITPQKNVFWLSAYFGPSFFPSVQVECGDGATATLCEPNVQEPTSMLVDRSGTFWVGGLTFNGDGQVATSARASATFPQQGVLQLINGPGSAVWALLEKDSAAGAESTIARLSATGNGVTPVQQFVLPAGAIAGSIALGGDGAIWFTDYAKQAVGRLAADGTMREYPAPHAIARPAYGQSEIASSCDGALWFTEAAASAVVRVNPASGSMVETALPTAGAYAGAISASPDAPLNCNSRMLWVGEQTADKLASFTY
ncbi:MAG: hypothetical protein ABR508_02885 [Candidatus Baltobacteraceae bacterium]